MINPWKNLNELNQRINEWMWAATEMFITSKNRILTREVFKASLFICIFAIFVLH